MTRTILKPLKRWLWIFEVWFPCICQSNNEMANRCFWTIIKSRKSNSRWGLRFIFKMSNQNIKIWMILYLVLTRLLNVRKCESFYHKILIFQNHFFLTDVFSYPEDKLACEHVCDTVVYECLSECGHESSCLRDCWIEHDKCSVNCPCNAKCLDGCPEPFDGHPCQTWFCQGHVLECAAEDDNDRDFCPYNSQDKCLESGCCWTHSDIPSVPWCHQPKKHILPSV